MKTCYYELLGLDRRAGEDEVKRAYRRRALALHPDKNIHRVAEATELFAAIQEAYTVLSDPHERAWYDSHREAILRGQEEGDASAGGASASASTSPDALLPFFSTKCFQGFAEGQATSFYTVYGQLFHRLQEEEEEACLGDPEALASEPLVHIWEFGDARTPYHPVVRDFYATWATFATVKSFRWHDKHNLAQAADRQTRRWMEKENAKVRDAARREFAEAVQALVAYVKKRDPRHAQFLREAKETQLERQRVQAERRAEEQLERRREMQAYLDAERQRQAEADACVEADPLLHEQDQDLSPHAPIPPASRGRGGGGDWAGEDPPTYPGEEDEDKEVYECVVCDKVFKTDKQFRNHEQSKKHMQAVKALRREMLHDGVVFDVANLQEALSTAEQPGELDVLLEDHGEPTAVAPSTPSTADPASEGEDDEEDVLHAGLGPGKPAPPEDALPSESGSALSKAEAAAAARLQRRLKRKEKRREQPAPSGGLKSKAKGKGAAATTTCAYCRQGFASRTKLFDHLRESGHAVLK